MRDSREARSADSDVRSIDLAAGRRSFLRSLGLSAAGAAAFGSGVFNPNIAKAAVTDVDILNFALNLEYLEAEFYQHAAFGRGLPPNLITGTGDPGAVEGGRLVDFDTKLVREYAQEIAQDELAHVKVLRSALGTARVARPALNIMTSFTRAARAAGLVGPTQSFNPYHDENSFLLGAFIFEDVGVTAYKGAASLIQNKTFLDTAAGLLAVEAYHASEIRVLLLSRGFAPQTQKISDLRDSVDGPSDLDQGVLLDGKANIVPTDENGLVFGRTTDQVLKIVYLGGGTGSGNGFFPKRMNGTIR